ncbi:alpha-taxilin-like [Prorops nasuta]|uniref:alpha-taxilin-like n=1 Tax=Prorops nasuta TaxID=863751 RepID=UPI0034CF8EB9
MDTKIEGNEKVENPEAGETAIENTLKAAKDDVLLEKQEIIKEELSDIKKNVKGEVMEEVKDVKDIVKEDPKVKENVEESIKENVKGHSKENSKDRRRNRDSRKENKSTKANLKNAQTPEEQIKLLRNRNDKVESENHLLRAKMEELSSRILQLQREKHNERSKAVLQSTRLESLCRELQKQNKALKEESLLRMKEGEEKIKEVSAKFQTNLAELSTLMNESIENNSKLHEDNVNIKMKFKYLHQQIELSEQQVQTLQQQMTNLRKELTTVKKTGILEKEALLKDKQQLLLRLQKYQNQVKDLQSTEVNLRGQIKMYTEKYDEFHNELTRSHRVYGEFNTEMEKMSKKIVTLEKETLLWKDRWEKSHAALLEMAAEKQISDREMAVLSKKASLLQDLCKMFQRERTSLLAQLKEKTGLSESEIIDKTETEQSAKQPVEEKGQVTAQRAFKLMQMGKAHVSEIMKKNFNEDASEEQAEKKEDKNEVDALNSDNQDKIEEYAASGKVELQTEGKGDDKIENSPLPMECVNSNESSEKIEDCSIISNGECAVDSSIPQVDNIELSTDVKEESSTEINPNAEMEKKEDINDRIQCSSLDATGVEGVTDEKNQNTVDLVTNEEILVKADTAEKCNPAEESEPKTVDNKETESISEVSSDQVEQSVSIEESSEKKEEGTNENVPNLTTCETNLAEADKTEICNPAHETVPESTEIKETESKNNKSSNQVELSVPVEESAENKKEDNREHKESLAPTKVGKKKKK